MMRKGCSLLKVVPLLGVLIVGHSAGGSEAGQPIPEDWQRIDAGTFVFFLPPHLEKQAAQGIDSYVGGYLGDAMYVSFDYGRWGIPLKSYAEKPEYWETTTTIGGHEARVLTYYDPESRYEFKYIAHVHFPNLGEGPLGVVKLTVSVSGRSPI